MQHFEIHQEACRGCRMCVDICPTEVLAFDEAAGKAALKEIEDCIACLSCTYCCPSQAIFQSGYHTVKNFYRDLDFSKRVARFL